MPSSDWFCFSRRCDMKTILDPEGYTLDLEFCSDPTANGDQVASYVRQWYEDHREGWCDRHWFPTMREPDRTGGHADEFMLRFVNVVLTIAAAADASKKP